MPSSSKKKRMRPKLAMGRAAWLSGRNDREAWVVEKGGAKKPERNHSSAKTRKR